MSVAASPYRPPSGIWPVRMPVLALFAALAVIAALALGAWRNAPAVPVPKEIAATAVAAEAVMARAHHVIADLRRARGIESEAADGTAASSLIGAELTSITTTTGNLEAKRVAVNAQWARALVLRLHQAGLREGDVVAAGFSGSFPGLNLAVVVAADSLGLPLYAISSVTASSYGANQPGFTWPEIEHELVRTGVIPQASVAVSVGGAGDRGLDLQPEGRAEAEQIARAVAARAGIAMMTPASFEAAVAERLAVYRRAAGGRPIQLYVNVGGTEPSLGRSPVILSVRNGFLPGVPFDFSPQRGLVARFAEQGVPVLTLLNVRDLAFRWGIL